MKQAAIALAITALIGLGFPTQASAAVERIFVLLNNTSAHPALIELIGSDKTLEEFELHPGQNDRRLVTLGSPVKVRLFPNCPGSKTATESAAIHDSRTTLMIYIHKDCRLQVNTGHL